MFRHANGVKAQYGDLTLLVAEEFNEWRVVVTRPGALVHGSRQFSEDKAREHARAVADDFREEHGETGAAPTPEWEPFGPDDWLTWRPS